MDLCNLQFHTSAAARRMNRILDSTYKIVELVKLFGLKWQRVKLSSHSYRIEYSHVTQYEEDSPFLC